MMDINLNKQVLLALNLLEDAGFEAYAVGGCVRDSILGREVSDFDITTSAAPSETKSVFSSYHVIDTGIKHGTVTVVIDGCPIEITTYRTESTYTDSRHPDIVTFVTDVNEDLARRDFTVNAIAYSPLRGFADPFDGISDIKNKTIRAVGDPDRRFSEDALRILRALRFSSVLSFEIEKHTSDAVCRLITNVTSVSPERIYAELSKLVCGCNLRSVLQGFAPTLSKLFPLTSDCLSSVRLPCDRAMRLTALFGNNTMKVLAALRADNDTKNKCKLLLDSTPIPSSKTQIKHYISSYGREDAEYVITYRRSLFNEDPSSISLQILHTEKCLTVKELDLNGNDLLAVGVNKNSVGRVLKLLLKSVIDGETENKKELLLEKAKVIDNCCF